MRTVKNIIFNREWKNPNGGTIYYHKIEWEDGKTGEFSTNKSPQTKFVIGKSYKDEEILEIPTTSKKGVSYIKFDKVRTEGGYSGGNKDVDPKTGLRIAKQVAAEDCIRTRKSLTWGRDANELVLNKYVEFIQSKEDKKASSNALRRAVDCIEIDMLTNIDDILKEANKWYNWFVKEAEPPKEESQDAPF